MLKHRILIVILFLCIIALIISVFIKINKYQLKAHTVIEKAPVYLIYVEIEDKVLYLLKDGDCIRKYPISSGMPLTPSPLGCWRITEKSDWGEGFGGSWMGLNVPWGKYGIHGTLEPGTIGNSSSAGCIRLYNRDVKELYDIVPWGTTVVIVNGSFGPFGTGFKEIEPGDRGADVMSIQKRLEDLGYFKGWASGIYEDDLKYALHRFQKDKGLEVQNTITRAAWLKMGFREFE